MGATVLNMRAWNERRVEALVRRVFCLMSDTRKLPQRKYLDVLNMVKHQERDATWSENKTKRIFFFFFFIIHSILYTCDVGG